jgi:hypothetical protein
MLEISSCKYRKRWNDFKGNYIESTVYYVNVLNAPSIYLDDDILAFPSNVTESLFYKPSEVYECLREISDMVHNRKTKILEEYSKILVTPHFSSRFTRRPANYFGPVTKANVTFEKDDAEARI